MMTGLTNKIEAVAMAKHEIITLWHNIDEIFNRMIQAIARTIEHIFATNEASRMIETLIQMSASIDLETGEVTDDDGTDE